MVMSSTNYSMGSSPAKWTDLIGQVYFTSPLLGIIFPLILFLFAGLASKTSRGNAKAQLPPGPRPLPLIGNLHQLIRGDLPHTLQRWHQIYGPLISFRIGFRTMISTGSWKVASDLLHRRSTIYNSRPRLIVAGKYLTQGLHPTFMPSGDLHRKNQWIYTNFLSRRRILSYRHLEDIESKQVLFDLLRSNDLHAQFRRLATSFIWTLVYGKRMESIHDPEIKLAKEMTEHVVSEAGNFKSGLVEAFPFLDVLPHFLAPWKEAGDHEFNRTVQNFADFKAQALERKGWNWTKEAVAAAESHGLNTQQLNYSLGFFLQAGTETISTTMDYFILACVLHPAIMRRAQAELDEVVGDSRLPEFTDMSDLPYMGVFLKELIRWQPLNPTGMMHAPTQDDEYMGYRIPEGVTVLPNNWTLDMDEDVFRDPFDFKPERWLDGARLPQVAFGYGGRRCAGQGLAMEVLFLMISRMLWAYDISLPGADDDKTDPDPWNLGSGLETQPPEFEAQFEVRGEKRREVIQSQWYQADKDAAMINDHIQAVNNEQNMIWLARSRGQDSHADM